MSHLRKQIEAARKRGDVRAVRLMEAIERKEREAKKKKVR